MSDLFGREFILNAGGTLISSRDAETLEIKPILKVSFQITKTLKREPNKAEISIWNLREQTRVKFQEKNIPTTVEAGYSGGVSQIFSGDLNFGSNVLDGTDWITTMQAGDGSAKFKSARINTSLKGPISVGKVLKIAGDALGLNVGNLQEKSDKGAIRKTLTEFSEGIVLSGKAEQVFDKVVKASGYSWSIQDGQIQLLEPVEVVGNEVVVLSPSSGLIGSPEAGENGIIKFRALIQARLLPGYKVKVESRQTDGFYRIEKAVFRGDTWGGDWYVDIEGKPL